MTPNTTPTITHYWASYNPVAARWQVLGRAYTDGVARSISGGAHPLAVVTAAKAAPVADAGTIADNFLAFIQ